VTGKECRRLFPRAGADRVENGGVILGRKWALRNNDTNYSETLAKDGRLHITRPGTGDQFKKRHVFLGEGGYYTRQRRGRNNLEEIWGG